MTNSWEPIPRWVWVDILVSYLVLAALGVWVASLFF